MNKQQLINKNIETEQQLSDAVSQIAAISETNPQYQAGLARKIVKSGKSVSDLTVSELLDLDARHNAYFNSLPH